MGKFLEQMDHQFAANRNKKELRHGGKKKTTLKTLMGEVAVKRNVYRKTDEGGQIQHLYLLDQSLGFETIGLISPNLAEQILELSCQKSYRQVAQTISELTNQAISHQGVWDVIQTAGQRQREAECETIKAHENYKLNGEREVTVLFEEADGVWLSMQGKSRRKKGNRRRELKIGIAYEDGSQDIHPQKNTKQLAKSIQKEGINLISGKMGKVAYFYLTLTFFIRYLTGTFMIFIMMVKVKLIKSDAEGK